MQNYRKEYQWKKYFVLQKYVNRFKSALGQENDVESLCAKEAFRRGLFSRRLPKGLVPLLVDFQSVRSALEANESRRGLDYELLEKEFEGLFHLIFLKTYNFMGSFDEDSLSGKWAAAVRDLKQRFPRDGGHFSAVWKRVVQKARSEAIPE